MEPALVFALSALVAVAIFLVLAWREIATAERRLPRHEYRETHVLSTEDGAFVTLRRLNAVGPESSLPPVLCVHGIGIDHHNVDMFEQRSIARLLARRGRDVWLLTLRSGMRPARRAGRRTSFAAMAQHDLPLAIREVRARTGRTELHYVGFSMGGMLLYAALPRRIPEGSVTRVAIMGSPGIVRAPDPISGFLAPRIPRFLVPAIPLESICRLLARPASWVITPIHHRIINPANMAAADYLPVMASIASIPQALLLDFVHFVSSEGRLTCDGEDVLVGLSHITVPVHFVAGEVDHVAPPSAVRAAYEAWGQSREGVEKEFWIAGRPSGAAKPYGHGDLAMGLRVEAEVLVRIADFLERP